MSDPTPAIAAAFAASFRDHRDRVHRLAEGVTDAQFWVRPYPYGNSMGHLGLHLTGNLNYFIGRQMAGTGYVRDREREFHDPNPPSKSHALQRLDEAVELAIATIEAQTVDGWTAAYSATGADDVADRFAMLLRAATHFYHHVGQMIYLAKEHVRQTTDDAAGSQPVG